MQTEEKQQQQTQSSSQPGVAIKVVPYTLSSDDDDIFLSQEMDNTLNESQASSIIEVPPVELVSIQSEVTSPELVSIETEVMSPVRLS